LIKNNQTLQELIDEVYEIVGRFSYNRDDLHLKEEQKLSIVENCQKGIYKDFDGIPVSRVEDLDGHKFYLVDEETVMIRASGTEPVLRIYAEAATEERVQVILDKVKKTLLG